MALGGGGLGLAVASSAPQGSQSLVSRGKLPVTVRIDPFFVRSRRSWELGILNVVSNRNSLPNERPAALTTRVARESLAGNMAANALNVRPHLFVRHAYLYSRNWEVTSSPDRHALLAAWFPKPPGLAIYSFLHRCHASTTLS